MSSGSMTMTGWSRMAGVCRLSRDVIQSGSGGVERGKGYKQAAAFGMSWNHAWHADEGKLVHSIEQSLASSSLRSVNHTLLARLATRW